VADLAARRSATPAQVALAWLLHQPGVTAPIAGATRQAHLAQAVAALEIRLSPDELSYLEEIYQPHPVLGFQ
jgi:aryl-alcohol dehydrogenase (NADP+)